MQAADLDYGGDEWWEDSRNITALATWGIQQGMSAQDIYDIFERPQERTLLWRAYRQALEDQVEAWINQL